MAAVLAKLTKLSPGPTAAMDSFSKAMSKLASYKHSPKYNAILDELIKSGVVSVQPDGDEATVTKVDPKPLLEEKVKEDVVAVPAIEETTQAPQTVEPDQTVEEPVKDEPAPAAESVDAKVLAKKKR
jgi:hypothetical protein